MVEVIKASDAMPPTYALLLCRVSVSTPKPKDVGASEPFCVTIALFAVKLETYANVVDKLYEDILLADKNPVLNIVVLRIGGITLIPAAGRPVSSEPSPMCFP